MSIENNLKKGVLYSFIPSELKIEGRPDLRVFPLNVLFAKYKTKDGKTIMGSALYEPNIESLKQDKKEWQMRYYNIYNSKDWLLIKYHSEKHTYWGHKFVNNKSAGSAFGIEWKMFFVHFTNLGLVNGERCKFEEVGQEKPKEDKTDWAFLWWAYNAEQIDDLTKEDKIKINEWVRDRLKRNPKAEVWEIDED
jgi:hypothetical protein